MNIASRLRQSCLLIAVGLAGLTLSSTASTALEEIDRIGSWSIHTSYSEPEGAFLSCLAARRVPGDDSRTLAFALTNYRFLEIWVFDEDWNLNVGEKYDVTYRIDNNPPWNAEFEVASKTGGTIGNDNAPALDRQLRQGNRLFIETAQGTLTFRLDGTAKALAAAHACRETRWEHRAKHDPFAGREQTTTNDGDPFAGRSRNERPAATQGDENRQARRAPEERTRSTRRVDRNEVRGTDLALVVVAGLQDEGFTILNAETLELVGIKSDAGWAFPKGMGQAVITPVSINEDQARQVIEVKEQLACTGQLEVTSRTRPLPHSADTIFVDLVCSAGTDGKPYYGIHAFFPLAGNRMMLVTHVSDRQRNVRRANEAFHAGMSRFMRDG